MIFLLANEYFIWINQFKTKFSFLQRQSASQYVTESAGKSRKSAVVFKITNIDPYSLYGGWHTYVSDIFSRI